MPPPQTLPDAAAQQQAALEVFAQYEPPLYEAYLDMMLEWLAVVRTAMFAGGVARLALVPDPMTVFSTGPQWAALTARYSARVAREVLAAPYRDLFADGTLFDSRPFVRNWIADTDNRLRQVPDEVFGLVSHIIDKATVNGASIPDVQDQIEQLFGDTGVQRWKNRARTVARTEVVGAYNGGLHDAFSMIAASDPETQYVHRWLATEDQRTRPDHREADGQVQPWGTPFVLGADADNPGGVLMMHPHAVGAPANQVVNCRCVELMEIENDPTPMGNRQYKGGTLSAAAHYAFNPFQRRDDDGKWTKGGGLLKNIAEQVPIKRRAVSFPPAPGMGAEGDIAARQFGPASEAGGSAAKALGAYGLDDHHPINQALKNLGQRGLKPEDRKVRSQISDLDGAMKKAGPSTGDAVLYRAVDPYSIFRDAWDRDGDNTGLEWTQHSYGSTSTDPSIAAGFGSTVFRLKVPKGIRGISMESLKGHPRADEKEVLLDRGLRYRVAKDHGKKDGIRYVDVEVSGNGGK